MIMRTRPERFSFVLILILSAALTGGAVRARGATAAHNSNGPLNTRAKLSQLPVGLAEAVERALGPAEGSDPGKYEQQQELQAPDSALFDECGFSVALNDDGHIALIGAPYKNSKGAAYVFTEQNNTWTEQQELTAVDGALGDNFGYSVALSDDGHIALIGAPFKNSKGAAYVFTERNNTWTEQQELQASDGAPNDEFGFSVALNDTGHIALVGAPSKNGYQGAAYVFTEQDSTWTEQQELTASDGVSGDQFGYSVALNADGHIALIGAPFKSGYQGAAYLFTEQESTWTEQQELTASDGAPGDEFGYSVALNNDGHIALIGAPFKNGSTGAAYVFTENGNTWTEQQELTAADGAPNDEFGYSVALNNDGQIALIGAPRKNSAKGAAYVFTAIQ
jgi:hypothetical protein